MVFAFLRYRLFGNRTMRKDSLIDKFFALTGNRQSAVGDLLSSVSRLPPCIRALHPLVL